MQKSYYISEINLPNVSAYAHHVLKMSDHLNCKLNNFELIVMYKKKNNLKIKSQYLLKSKKKLIIQSIFKTFKENNFIFRFLFGFFSAIYVKKNPTKLIITRSLYSSFFLILFKISHFLEIHHELKGLSNFFFCKCNFINSKYLKKVIFISKELSKLFKIEKKKKLILHDAVDISNFKVKLKNNKIIKKIGYIGSFYSGRGIQLMIDLAKLNNKFDFYLIGNNSHIYKKKCKKIKNIFFKNYIRYSKVPKTLATFDVLLMPYQKKVEVNSKDLNTANYCSPLKMFDYLASSKVIISSRLPGISEILKNNYNSFLVQGENLSQWDKVLKKICKKSLKKIKQNAFLTAKKHTWEKRVNKILSYN